MTNDRMFLVLLAPGLASCFCFVAEDFVEYLRDALAEIRCHGKIW